MRLLHWSWELLGRCAWSFLSSLPLTCWSRMLSILLLIHFSSLTGLASLPVVKPGHIEEWSCVGRWLLAAPSRPRRWCHTLSHVHLCALTSWESSYGGCLKLVSPPCVKFALPAYFCSCFHTGEGVGDVHSSRHGSS